MSHSIGRPLMKAVINYRFHPTIIAIKKNFNSSFSFSISQVGHDDIMKKNINFKTNKGTHFIEITPRHGCSPVNLLHVFRTPFPRDTSEKLLLKSAKTFDNNYRPVKVHYQILLRYMKDSCLNKCQNILNLSYQNISVVLEEGLVPNIVYQPC